MKLTEAQRQAITTVKGPVLILAGAGSGKTTTLTLRYQFLRRNGVDPNNILMVTFTRKAANEMKRRMLQKEGTNPNDLNWTNTFHKICMDILRNDGIHIRVNSDYGILNEYEARKFLKQFIAEHNLSGGDDETEDIVTPSNVLSEIGLLKSYCIDETVFATRKPAYSEMNWDKCVSYLDTLEKEKPELYNALQIIYPAYEQFVRNLNKLDLDDILLKTVQLFEKKPDILARYQEKFHYILVDEYQDTNYVQNALVTMLAGSRRNICVVGDDNQSIYAFRGSKIDNILEFPDRFPGTTVVKMQENFRSTPEIVSLSNALIARNVRKTDKVLVATRDNGENVRMNVYANEQEELVQVANKVQTFMKAGKNLSQIAVLTRTNAQLPLLAKSLNDIGIPFEMKEDIEFTSRTEIRDLLAYADVFYNPENHIALRRIINTPKRGIGKTTEDKLLASIKGNAFTGITSFLASNKVNEKATKGLRSLVEYHERFGSILREKGLGALFSELLSELQYEDAVGKSMEGWQVDNLRNNLSELVRLAELFHTEKLSSSPKEFVEFLDNLVKAEVSNEPRVQLMTVHKSKGLEFSVVFVIGLDHVTFPNYEKVTTEEEIEEERRVCYVACTRAKDELFLSYPRMREKRIEGEMKEVECEPSIFFDEMNTILSHS